MFSQQQLHSLKNRKTAALIEQIEQKNHVQAVMDASRGHFHTVVLSSSTICSHLLLIPSIVHQATVNRNRASNSQLLACPDELAGKRIKTHLWIVTPIFTFRETFLLRLMYVKSYVKVHSACLRGIKCSAS